MADKVTPPLISFNSGEVGELVEARSDITKYQSACLVLENALPLVEGPAKKMPGSYYVCPAKNANEKARLISFSFSTIQDYIIEMGNQYMRFFMDEGQIVIDPSECLDFDPTNYYWTGAYTKLGAYGEFVWTSGTLQLDISFPHGATVPSGITVGVNTSNTLSVSVVAGVLTILLANTTAANNLADLIQQAIYALGTSGGVNYTKAVVTANAAYTASPPIITPSNFSFNATGGVYQCIQAIPNLAGSGYFVFSGGNLTFSYATPVWSQVGGTVGPPIKIALNSVDYLNVKMQSGPNGTYLTVLLANTTAAKNDDDSIQIAINKMGVIDGVPYWNMSVTGETTSITAPIESFWGNNTSFFLTNTSYWTPVTIGNPAEIPTPYLEADLFEIDCDTQSADVLYLFHEDYPPAKLMRYSHINWEYILLSCTGTIDINKTGAGGIAKSIRVVATDNNGGNENPAEVTVVDHGFYVGDRVYISGVQGCSEYNEIVWEVILINDKNNFSINFNANGVYDCVKDTGTVVRVDKLFNSPGDYPACGCFYDQRLYFAGSLNNPTQFNGSVQGDFENFISDPSEDDYAVQFTLVSEQVDQIRRMMATSTALLLGTMGGLWSVAASSGAAITQNNVMAQKQISTGVSFINPKRVNEVAIWTSRSARIVYFIIYNFITNQWENYDLTRLNRQITMGDGAEYSGIVQTAFQAEPYPIFWALRADGQLLGLVYNKQDQVFAWFRLVTNGIIESVACISQDNAEDQVWQLVQRTINGNTVRYIEYYMPHELFHDVRNAFFVHCGLTWDSGNAIAITNITQANPAVVTAPGHSFKAGDYVTIQDVGGMVQANISDYLKAYLVANPSGNTFQLSGINSIGWTAYTSGGWVKKVTNVLTGLSYLEGEMVDIVIEGEYCLPQQQVTSGTVNLGFYYSGKISVGLHFTTTVQTMKLNAGSRQGASRGKRQKVNRITLILYETIGGTYGRVA